MKALRRQSSPRPSSGSGWRRNDRIETGAAQTPGWGVRPVAKCLSGAERSPRFAAEAALCEIHTRCRAPEAEADPDASYRLQRRRAAGCMERDLVGIWDGACASARTPGPGLSNGICVPNVVGWLEGTDAGAHGPSIREGSWVQWPAAPDTLLCQSRENESVGKGDNPHCPA
jgi:hypothetical protein